MLRGGRTADLPLQLNAGWVLVHGCVGEGNFFFFNPKQEKRSLIVERKIRMV